ncbi:hypothetical protein, partial [Methylobacterium sp. GC_Met_2]|uniref:hypothetical protein n=1 Tax=Methylobacterium sp. GC_Met_2 TaxID=2937376 RepID=UPI00226B6F70
ATRSGTALGSARIDLVGQGHIHTLVDELHLTKQHQQSEYAPKGYEFQWRPIIDHTRRSSVVSREMVRVQTRPNFIRTRYMRL